MLQKPQKRLMNIGFKELNLDIVYADLRYENMASHKPKAFVSGTKNDVKIISEDFWNVNWNFIKRLKYKQCRHRK